LYRALALGTWQVTSGRYIMYSRFNMMANTSTTFLMYSKYEAM
jgi:hypothetical protein